MKKFGSTKIICTFASSNKNNNNNNNTKQDNGNKEHLHGRVV